MSEGLKNITPEQKAQILAEMERKERIRTLNFIKSQYFIEFLNSNGYLMVGYDYNGYNFDKNWITFSSRIRPDDCRRTNRKLILLGPQTKWGKYVDEFSCKNIANNPFVKWIKWDLTEFKVYSIVDNPDAGGWGGDEPGYMAKLETDLSNEWIRFWATKEPDYAKFVLDECAQVQKKTPEDIKHYDNLLAKRIAELKAEHAKQIKGVNEKQDKYNQIEQIIKSVKGDLQV